MHALPQILDFSAARSLRDTISPLVVLGAMTLDASMVERMSTPCMQVLLATGRAAQSLGASFTIINASPVFLSAIVDLGLQADFSDWVN